jgi:hypothetical protein
MKPKPRSFTRVLILPLAIEKRPFCRHNHPLERVRHAMWRLSASGLEETEGMLADGGDVAVGRLRYVLYLHTTPTRSTQALQTGESMPRGPWPEW